MSSEFYNKQGQPISLEIWSELRKDPDYRFIGNTYVHDTKGFLIRVSTIWLGVNAAWHPDITQLFESMVFNEDFEELTSNRYETLEEAKQGHADLVARVDAGEFA